MPVAPGFMDCHLENDGTVRPNCLSNFVLSITKEKKWANREAIFTPYSLLFVTEGIVIVVLTLLT